MGKKFSELSSSEQEAMELEYHQMKPEDFDEQMKQAEWHVRPLDTPGMNATIYIPLMDEGTDVWRPVSAERVADEIYRVTSTPPDDTETWEFTTGDTVRCREQSFSSGERRLVAYERFTDNAATLR